jgi:hypothetical protein
VNLTLIVLFFEYISQHRFISTHHSFNLASYKTRCYNTKQQYQVSFSLESKHFFSFFLRSEGARAVHFLSFFLFQCSFILRCQLRLLRFLRRHAVANSNSNYYLNFSCCWRFFPLRSQSKLQFDAQGFGPLSIAQLDASPMF